MLLNELNSESKILATVNKFLTELMPLLRKGLPRPEIIIRNTKSSPLGSTKWGGEYENGRAVPRKNTIITIQKRATAEDRTLKRVLAHELCHHEDFLNGYDDAVDMGWMRYHNVLSNQDGHGPSWLKIAERFNKIYGPEYVTKYSDETDVIEEINAFYVLLIKSPDGKMMFQQSSRLTNNIKMYILERKHAELIGNTKNQYKLVRTKNSALILGQLIGNRKYSNFVSDEDKKILADLWNNSEDLALRGLVEK
jgi:hypothetical protein